MPQEGAQCNRKIQACAFIDVYLIDAWQINFSRVFCRGDIDAGLVEQVKAGVQRYRLAGACGPGDQYHAVGSLYRREKQGFLVFLVA